MSARSRPTALLEAVLTRTGLDVDVARAGAELEGLVAGPWAAYEADPDGRRFALTESGAPFELSVKVAADGEMSIRYVVDVADHTRDLAGNAARYLQASISTGPSTRAPFLTLSPAMRRMRIRTPCAMEKLRSRMTRSPTALRIVVRLTW